jgi:O-antigen/teichoic acid export membrane protein
MITISLQTILIVIGFISTVYFAHAVGAGVLGSYYLFTAYFGILTLFGDYGLGGAAIKRISEGIDQDAYFSALVILRFIFFTVLIIGLFIFHSLFIDLVNSGMFYWLLAALALVVFKGSISYANVGCSKMGVVSTTEFIDQVLRLLVQIAAVFLGYGAAGLAGGFVAGMIASGLIGLRFLDLHLVSFGYRHLKSLFVFAFWSFLTTGGSLVFTQADTVLIGYFMNNADVGVYRVALGLALMVGITTAATREVLYPRVSRWNQNRETGLIERSLSRAFTYSLLFAIPVFIGGLILSDKLLFYLYGTEFARGSTVLIILLAVQMISIFQSFFASYLNAMDFPKEVFKITLITAVINIIMDIILIPVYGIEGAAIATLITISLNVAYSWKIISRIIHVRIETDSLINILKATGVMGGMICVYRLLFVPASFWMILLPIVLGGTAYIIVLLKLDRNIRDDLKKLHSGLSLPDRL